MWAVVRACSRGSAPPQRTALPFCVSTCFSTHWKPNILSAQVLADVGDGQSLQQSLSTFSAHVRRLRLILAAATPSSLTLLDEVGSGALSLGTCDGVWRQPRCGPWQ